MLTFIIPLKSEIVARDWKQVGRLLERTLESACNQQGAPCRAIVVCHEIPADIRCPENCEFIRVPFSAPDLQNLSMKSKESLWPMRTDKGRKILFGIERARELQGSQYLMILDADDLVSNRLAAFVEQHQGAHGWYIDYGYRLNEDQPKVVFRRRRFYCECGSSYILRSDIVPFPEQPDYSLEFDDYFIRRYVVHAHLKDDLNKRGFPLDPVPFYGGMYSFNGQNIFASTFRRKESRFRRLMQYIVKGCAVSQHMQQEFGLRSIE